MIASGIFRCGSLNPFIWIMMISFHFQVLICGRKYEPVAPSSEKRLIKQIVDNYAKVGKIGRPVKNTKDTVLVGFGLSLFQLLDLDEKNQILTVNVWAKYTWVDQLLRWDPANYSGIREVRIPPTVIWTPDIVLYNYVDERLVEYRDVMLNVDYMGHVFWSPPAIFKSSCEIDIRHFPFDYQFCYLRFASRTLFSDQMELQFWNNRTEVDVEQYTSSNEWTIVARPAHRFVMMSEQCGKTIPDLTFFLFLKRNPAFFAYILVLPCILLSFITSVIFWLPPYIPAKMVLSMNIFVAFSLLLKILARSTPSATTSLPFLSYFYCLNMVLLSVSTFVSTAVTYINKYCHTHRGLPPWLHKMLRLVAKPLSLTPPDEEEESKQTLSSVAEILRSKKQVLKDKFYCQQMMKPRTLVASDFPPHSYPGLFESGESNFAQSKQFNLYNNARQMAYGRDTMPLTEYWNLGGHLGQFSSPSQPPPPLSQTTRLQWSQHSTPERALDEADKNGKMGPGDNDSNDSGVSDGYPDPQYATTYGFRTRKTPTQIHANLSYLREALKQFMERLSKKDAAAKRASDWRLVSTALDRFAFWIYLTITIIANLCLLMPPGEILTVEEMIRMHADKYTMRNKETAADCLLPKLQIPGYYKGF